MHEQSIHTDRRFYYVSVIDGHRKALLAGPYEAHEAALAQVETVRRMAEEIDPRAHWYGFGTAGSDVEHPTRFGVVTGSPAATVRQPVEAERLAARQGTLAL